MIFDVSIFSWQRKDKNALHQNTRTGCVSTSDLGGVVDVRDGVAVPVLPRRLGERVPPGAVLGVGEARVVRLEVRRARVQYLGSERGMSRVG